MCYYISSLSKRSPAWLCGFILLFSSSAFSEQESDVVVLTLDQAEQLALKDEPGLKDQQWQIQSLSERAIADGQLKDHKLLLRLSNLPTNSFDFDQENMTHFTETKKAEKISQTLAMLAKEMTESGGIVAIEPVTHFFNIEKSHHGEK